MFFYLREDIKAFREHHGRSWLAMFYYPMFSAVLLFRFSAWLYKIKLKPLAYLCVRLNDFLHGVWIGPRVAFGPGMFLGHARGLVINPETKIGARATILQGVTIGGPGIVIGDGVFIGASASIISRPHKGKVGLTIGSFVKIGAGAVVISDVPDNAVMVGNPARNLKEGGSENT